VLEVTDLARREDELSSPSIMRVGVDLDIEASSRGASGQNDETCQIRLAARRRELARYVIGAVVMSCAILVMSFVKYETVPRGSQSRAAPAVAPPVATLASAPPPSPANIPTPPPLSIQATQGPSQSVALTTAPSSGTLRFVPPAKSGWVWLDGKRLTGTSAIVSCGTHQLKVGYFAKHAVTVPCGGELVLSR